LLKRFIAAIVAIQLFAFGGTAVFAEEPPASSQNQEWDSGAEQKSSEQNQQTNSEVSQNQSADTNNSGEVLQGQDVQGNTSQEQANGSNKQTQTDEVTASQGQLIKDVDSVDAEQDQDASLNSNQSQQVTTPDGSKNHDQETKVTSDQNQEISLDGKTDAAAQVQTTHIETTQQGELGEDSEQLGQKTSLEAKQGQGAITSGEGKMEQIQTVEASGNVNPQNGKEKSGTLKAVAENVIEIIKEEIGTIIKIFQRITVNGNETVIDEEYVLNTDGVEQVQKYSQRFDWGTLNITNKALVEQLTVEDIKALMSSEISFDFALRGQDRNDSDSAEDLLAIDSDGDGITDFLERVKFKTDPFNPDTDGDGLTDLFEVVYHDAAKTEYFPIIDLDFQQKTDALTAMDYKPNQLNPLKKDTDSNGVMDGEEDFDQDGLTNLEEQQKGQNPYQKN
jgi:hypothetical protein